MARRKVLNHHDGCWKRLRETTHHSLECLDAAGRGTDHDDIELSTGIQITVS